MEGRDILIDIRWAVSPDDVQFMQRFAKELVALAPSLTIMRPTSIQGAPMACAVSPLDFPLHPDLSILAHSQGLARCPETEIGGTNSAAYDFAECRLSAAPSARASKLPAMKLNAIVPANWMLSRHSSWVCGIIGSPEFKLSATVIAATPIRPSATANAVAGPVPRPLNQKYAKPNPDGTYHGNKPQISNVEIERINNHVMKNDKEHKRHDEIS